jgi:transcriptional regulator with XRE-family HTH domain
MNIGKGIKTVLEKKKMTQKELAEVTGISPTSISLIMLNRTQPRKETIQAISQALSISPEILFLLSVEKEDIPESKKPHYDYLWPNIETSLLNLFTEEKPKE